MRRSLLAFAFLLGVPGLGLPGAFGAEADSRWAEIVNLAQAGTGANRPVVSAIMALVGPGAGVMTSSLSIPAGAGRSRLLVRAAGPALKGVGVNGALQDPAIAVFDRVGVTVGANDNWSSNAVEIAAASAQAGALPFAAGSLDAAVVIELDPGHYTLQVRSVGGDTGAVLVEIYEIPRAAAPAAEDGKSPAATAGANRAPTGKQLLLHLPLRTDFQDASRERKVVWNHGVTLRDGAAWFDGNRSALVIPHQPLERHAFAVAMWVKVEDGFPTCGLVEQFSANRRNEHLHLMLRETKPHLGFYVNDLRVSAAVTPRDGWTHLVFQYTGRRQEIWINGQCAGTRRARAYAGTGGEFVIGRTPHWTNVPSHDFKGGLRDVFVYSRALTAPEIATLAGSRK